MPQQSQETKQIDELIERTLTDLRAASADLTEVIERGDVLPSLVQTASGTALLHALRQQIDHLNRLLPFKS